MDPTILRTPSQPQTLTLDEVGSRLGQAMLQSMTRIATIRENTLTNPDNLPRDKWLSQGIWHTADYYRNLKASLDRDKSYKARYDFLLEKGTFLHGLAPSSHFRLYERSNPEDYTGKAPFYYYLKPDVKASEAIEALLKGCTFMGCDNALDLCRHMTLQSVLGTAKYDALFSRPDTFLTTLMTIVALMEREAKGVVEQSLKPGDAVYIKSLSFSNDKHWIGGGEGFNVVYKGKNSGGENEYVGYDLPPTGVSAKQIGERLLKFYNASPISPHELAAPKYAVKLMTHCIIAEAVPHPRFYYTSLGAARNALKDDQSSWDEYIKYGGNTLESLPSFNVKKIHELANKSIPQACQTLKTWNEILDTQTLQKTLAKGIQSK